MALQKKITSEKQKQSESHIRLVGDEKTSESKEMVFSTLNSKELVDGYIGKDIILISLDGLEEIKEKSDLTEEGTGDGTVSMYPLNIFDADFDEETLDKEKLNPHVKVLEIFEQMSDFPGVYIPIKMVKRGETQYPVLPQDYVEMLYEMTKEKEYPKLSIQQEYILGSGWYPGIVVGVTSGGDSLTYSWKHGVQLIKRESLKGKSTLKIGQMVDIGINNRSTSGKKISHLSKSHIENDRLYNGIHMMVQGELLTKYPLQKSIQIEDKRKSLTQGETKKEKISQNQGNNIQEKLPVKGLSDKEFQRNKRVVDEIVKNLDLDKVGHNFRIGKLAASYLPSLERKDAIPGTKVRSRNGAPGIILPKEKGDQLGSGFVKVAYFREDSKGNRRKIIARTNIKNLKKRK